MSATDTMERPQTAQFPTPDVDRTDFDTIKVRVQGIQKGLLLDQGNDVQVDAGQGCISSPNGPRC